VQIANTKNFLEILPASDDGAFFPLFYLFICSICTKSASLVAGRRSRSQLVHEHRMQLSSFAKAGLPRAMRFPSRSDFDPNPKSYLRGVGDDGYFHYLPRLPLQSGIAEPKSRRANKAAASTYERELFR
jgi:hypothetical protein